jgi:hypothetical protein
MENLISFFASLPSLFGTSVATIIGLIFLDVVLGMAAALRTGQFQWDAMSRFYRTQVVPGLIGYVALSAAMLWVAPDLLGEASDLVTGAAITLAWGAVVSDLVTSIRGSFLTIYHRADKWDRDLQVALDSIEEDLDEPGEAEGMLP